MPDPALPCVQSPPAPSDCPDCDWQIPVLYLGFAACILILVLIASACKRCQQRKQGAVAAAAAVQMGPAAGSSDGQTDTGAPACGPQPAGYPPAGISIGCGSQPLPAIPPLGSHQPAPMPTMTIGLLADAEHGDSAAPIHTSSFYPPPTSSSTTAGGPAAGGSTSGPYPGPIV
jgi:hypothetical protein